MEKSEHKNKETKKKILNYLKNIYIVIIPLVLLGVFFCPYYIMKNHFPTMEEQKTEGTKEERDVKKGTYCTYKSNSLDGVPVFDHAGDTLDTGLIPEGKYVQLLDACSVDGEEWAQIDYCGLTKWLPMKRIAFITENDAYIKEGSKVYINTETEFGLEAREEPSATSDVVADHLEYGEEFTVSKLKDGWGKVKCDGKSCWINMYHVGSYGTSVWKINALNGSGEVNFREEGTKDSKSIGKVPEDTVLTIQEFKDGWGRVEYDGQTGWVMLHYLIPVEG